MSNQSFFKMMDSALSHVSVHAERADRLALALYKELDGEDNYPDHHEMLYEMGYTDEDGVWIGED